MSAMSTTPTTRLGWALRTARHRAGMTLRQVSQASEGRLDNAVLSQLENGRSVNPTARILLAISDTLGISCANLFEYTAAGGDLLDLDQIDGHLHVAAHMALLSGARIPVQNYADGPYTGEFAPIDQPETLKRYNDAAFARHERMVNKFTVVNQGLGNRGVVIEAIRARAEEDRLRGLLVAEMYDCDGHCVGCRRHHTDGHSDDCRYNQPAYAGLVPQESN
jgi:transcriptional regulator with XRE-family HTH domain